MALALIPGLSFAACFPLSTLAADREVVVLDFGGTHERNMERTVIPDFERKTGLEVVYVSGTMAANFARVQAQRGRPEAEVAGYFPYGPGQVKSLVQLDIAAMKEHVARWVERWNKEAERK
jgi:ABC-type glycerol-3-phosphate transport system substrate-binding protein